jgi:hypothetical protein
MPEWGPFWGQSPQSHILARFPSPLPLPIPRQTVENIISFENAVKGVHAHSHQGSISESDSPRANEEEESAASEGLKDVEKRKSLRRLKV